MTKEEQGFLEIWFEDYIDRFRDQDSVLHPMLELKRCHSLRVAGNARFISAALNLPEAEQYLAEGVGLDHDVGRFTRHWNWLFNGTFCIVFRRSYQIQKLRETCLRISQINIVQNDLTIFSTTA